MSVVDRLADLEQRVRDMEARGEARDVIVSSGLVTKADIATGLAETLAAIPDEVAGLRAALERSTRELVAMTQERDRWIDRVKTLEGRVASARAALTPMHSDPSSRLPPDTGYAHPQGKV